MFIHVYSTEDKNKLINKGFKLVNTVEISNGYKYVFSNPKNLKFDNLEVKCTYSNRLTF